MARENNFRKKREWFLEQISVSMKKIEVRPVI